MSSSSAHRFIILISQTATNYIIYTARRQNKKISILIGSFLKKPENIMDMCLEKAVSSDSLYLKLISNFSTLKKITERIFLSKNMSDVLF